MKLAGHTPTDWLKFAARVGEESLSRSRKVVRRTIGRRRPVRIVPYRGYGNGTTAVISGRVLENREARDPLTEDSWWRNVRSMYRQFATVPVRGCGVSGRYAGCTLETASDEDGYFQFHFENLIEPAETQRGWHPVELSARDDVKALGQILVPPAGCDFGVISDMDDTVIESHATNFWKIGRLTLLKNARTRMPFEGVAAFYRALHAGGDGTRHNPIFYVSSSAWNLYDLFRIFLEHNDIPSGPVLLRDYGIDEDKFVVEMGHRHKLRKIEAILAMYPDLPFVLIGDSGQDDPVLYQEAVAEFPGRVQAVYIRDVRRQTQANVGAIAAQVTATGTPMLLVPDTVAAAEHAATLGLISAAALDDIRQDRAADHDPNSARQPVA